MRMILSVLTLKLTSESKPHHLWKLLNIISSAPLSLFLNSCSSPELVWHLCLYIYLKTLNRYCNSLPSAHRMKFKLHRLPFQIFHNLISILVPSLLVDWFLTVPRTCHVLCRWNSFQTDAHLAQLYIRLLGKRVALLDPRSWVLNLKPIHSVGSLKGLVRCTYLLKLLYKIVHAHRRLDLWWVYWIMPPCYSCAYVGSSCERGKALWSTWTNRMWRKCQFCDLVLRF